MAEEMTRAEIMGLKKAAIVLKAVADSITNPIAKKETIALVKCVVKAANIFEEEEIKNG